MNKIKTTIGAMVLYCGHNASFAADLYEADGGTLVVACEPKHGQFEQLLHRPAAPNVTHHMVDFPQAGYWNPSRGVFFVPAGQLTPVDPDA